VAGAATAPQVFAGGKKIGGSEALEAWLKESHSRTPTSPQQPEESHEPEQFLS